MFFFFSSRRRHTRCLSDWSSDVCSSDLPPSGGSRGGNPPFSGPSIWAGRPAKLSRLAHGAVRRLCRYLCVMSERGLHQIEDDLSDTWLRSEERRVGKECRSRWQPHD